MLPDLHLDVYARGSYFLIVPNSFLPAKINLKVLVPQVGINPGHLGVQYFALTTAPRGLLPKALIFLSSLILLFQSRNDDLKVLITRTGLDPQHYYLLPII